ncbi:hypothetical protein [Variovorax sp. PvP013]|uniref:hypothetical protein n=1 Tax=Variovorax sp. PvP013 TaxID=3156435 RepID=UPI003D1D2AEF
MAAALGRSSDAISLRRQRITQVLKRKSPQKWDAEQDFLLAELYGKVDTVFLAAVLGRSLRVLRDRASLMGLQIKNLWSPEEDAILREHFPYAPVSRFAKLLPARGLGSIYDRADTLALSRDPSYMLRTPKLRRFWAYPPELRSLIQLFNQVERRLRDVQAKH